MAQFDVYSGGELLKQARRAVERGNLDEAEAMIKAIHQRRGTTPPTLGGAIKAVSDSAIKTAQRPVDTFGRRTLVQTACGSFQTLDLDAPSRWWSI